MSDTNDIEVIELEAAQWVVRGQGPDFSDEDMIGLTLWLEAADRHVEAYDRALMLWAQLDELTDVEDIAFAPPVMAQNVVSLNSRRASRVTVSPMVWGGGIAAALALLVSLPFITAKPAHIDIYQTAKGQSQTVTLADGSVLNLNTDTKITVQFSGNSRKLMLDHGEVALKVTHDEKRPLTLVTGDESISDLGTEFAVRRHDGAIRVAVREGSVSLGASILRAGDLAEHREGSTETTLTHANAEEAFAWRTAHAIYHDQTLADVVKDLNRYYDKPLIVDEQSGKLRLTAILTLDSETSVVGRLQDFLPLDARTTGQGIYLRASAHQSHKPAGAQL